MSMVDNLHISTPSIDESPPGLIVKIRSERSERPAYCDKNVQSAKTGTRTEVACLVLPGNF